MLAKFRTLDHGHPITVGIDGYSPTQTQEIVMTFPSAREYLAPETARRLGEALIALAAAVDVARKVGDE